MYSPRGREGCQAHKVYFKCILHAKLDRPVPFLDYTSVHFPHEALKERQTHICRYIVLFYRLPSNVFDTSSRYFHGGA